MLWWGRHLAITSWLLAVLGRFLLLLLFLLGYGFFLIAVVHVHGMELKLCGIDEVDILLASILYHVLFLHLGVFLLYLLALRVTDDDTSAVVQVETV